MNYFLFVLKFLNFSSMFLETVESQICFCWCLNVLQAAENWLCFRLLLCYYKLLGILENFQYIWDNRRRKYVGNVYEMDVAVSNIYRALESRGVLDNTIIVFSTDNGGAPNGYDSNYGSNFPLRAGKGYFFEGGARGVGFVWGDVFKKRSGEVSMDLMHVSDWMPTLYEAAGGSVGKLGDIDSHSLWPVLTGVNRTCPRSEVLVNLNPVLNSKAIKVGKYKYLLNPYDRWDAE